jgi:hypothetical protein
MIAPSPFWRVIAWIGAILCGREAAEEAGSGAWQDKSSAVRWGGEEQNCWTFSASRLAVLLAAWSIIGAILAFSAPSHFRHIQIS